MNSDNDPKAVISEVGSNESRNEEKIPEITYAEKLLCSMETLLARVLAVQAPVVSNNRSPLLKFDPDDTESDIDDWCKVTEVIVQSKRLEGVDLLVALTGALKGRAATYITKLNLDEITWESVKEILIARFLKPKLIQDYFDDVWRFQIGAKETASESALRLWNLIEKIPQSTMCEEVITGFVISVLCQKDNLIRRELNAQTVTGRAQLFRILGGISLKRRLDAEAQGPEAKRARLAEKFPGKCHYCGLTGHRIAECRKRRNDAEPKTQEASSSSRSTEKRPVVTCYVCGQSSHVATVCPDRKSNSGAAVKEVHRCEHRSSRGTLKTSSDPLLLISTMMTRKATAKDTENKLKLALLELKKCKDENSLLLRERVDCEEEISEVNHKVVSLKGELAELHIENMDLLDQRDRLQHEVSSFGSCNETYEWSLSRINELETSLHEAHTKIISLERLAPAEKLIVREKVQQLLDAGVIRESSSPFASPILLVKKKDNSYRLCVDYRELNSNTQPDHYPLPRIEEHIDQLAGASWFSLLDMASGFHGIMMHPDSVERTAFVTPDGQYEYLAMPFGLRNAPSVYQRCITRALSHLTDKPLIYMDDVLCHSAVITVGLKRLDMVLSALTRAGFTLNLQKCKFLKQKIDYLGFSLQSGEVRPNSRKILALSNSPQPKTATQVRQFLGLAYHMDPKA
ncbi:uncharacterized protein LOC142985971 [Anticarsia gemmatalis]|uniref:uncharacterized protein LOC142985971 n=1 Tax=Anticarsia gemmatalis TaxID=129554 RepID=UPI003F76F38A